MAHLKKGGYLVCTAETKLLFGSPNLPSFRIRHCRSHRRTRSRAALLRHPSTAAPYFFCTAATPPLITLSHTTFGEDAAPPRALQFVIQTAAI